MNAISYCLFGSAPIYNVGAIRNAEMAKDFYPGWQTVFYIDEETVPAETADKLEALGAEIRLYSSLTDPNGMFLRFWIADAPNVERFIVRDCDSRPCQREVNAVNAWIESGKQFHVMRDHPYHCVPMLGGLWGAVGGALKGVEKSTKRFHRYKTPYTREHAYGADQEWLWENVFPKAVCSGVIHDSCCRDRYPFSVPFPDDVNGRIPYGDWRFAGEIFSEEDCPHMMHFQMRLRWMTR